MGQPTPQLPSGFGVIVLLEHWKQRVMEVKDLGPLGCETLKDC